MFPTAPVLLLGDTGFFQDLRTLPITSVLSVLFLLSVLATIGIVLYKERKTSIEVRKVSFFFWLELAYMALLIAIGAVYMTCLPQVANETYLMGGIVPCAIPWFGALGAVLIGLEGVFMHNKEWDSKYNYWHIARPIIGAVLGFVAFFILVLLLKSSGTSPAFLTPGNPKFSSTDLVLFYVLAFLVGYREETFRELIKRATDLILAQTTQGPLVPKVIFIFDGLVEERGNFAATALSTSVSKKILVKNSGTADLENAVITFANDSPDPGAFTPVTNPLKDPGVLAQGDTKTLLVEFKPTKEGTFTATLTVKGNNMPSQTFTLEGKCTK